MSKSFKENDIRPNDLNVESKKAMKEDIKRLLDQKDEFVEVDCPACTSNNYKFAFQKHSFDFVQCQQCETVFMNPRATPEILHDFYGNSKLYNFWNKYIFPASMETRREKIFKPRVKRIIEICEKYDVPTRSLIDVGAGYGFFCHEVQNTHKFNQVIAVEPNKLLAAQCRTLGIEVIENAVENINNTDFAANVISSFENIEHLFSPVDFINKCKKLLSDKSILILTCPNYKGFDIEVLKEKSESIDAEHINLFNPRSISLLLNRCGFKVLECMTPGELDAEILRKRVLSLEYNIDDQPFLRTVLIDQWEELGDAFQGFLKQNKMSSHMWIVATLY